MQAMEWGRGHFGTIVQVRMVSTEQVLHYGNHVYIVNSVRKCGVSVKK